MRARIGTIGVLLAALLLSAARPGTAVLAASTTTDAAVAYQINAAHSGSLSSDTLRPPLVQAWSRDLGGPISYPLIAGGRVFVTVGNPSSGSNPNYGSTIYALDEATGSTIWSLALGGTYYWSAATYDNGRIFVVNESGLVRALDAATGTQYWSAQMPGQSSFSSPPIAVNGVVYLGGAGSGGTLYAVDETNGTVRWTASVMNGGDSSPAYGNNGVYVSYACPQTYAFDPLKGSPLWHYSGPCEGGGGSTPVYANGDLYVSDNLSSPSGYTFDGGSGAVLGRFGASYAPSFFGQTMVSISGITSSTGGTLHAMNSAGTAIWSFGGDGTLTSNPIVVNDEVYVGGRSGNVYAVNLATGHQDWTASVGSPLQSTNGPTVGLGAGEGYLVVPATNTLTAFTSPQNTTAATGITATEGLPFSGTMAAFSDSGASSSNDTASIDWGDGSSSPGIVTATVAGSYIVTGSHTYTEEGSYGTTVTIHTSDGNTMALTGGASVADAALSSTGYTLKPQASGTAFTTRVATMTDTNSGCPTTDYSATVNWGDGSSSPGTIAPGSSACSFDISGSHTYASTGSFTITVTTSDKGGTSTTTTSSVSVSYPVISTTPSTLTFGGQDPGTTSAPQSVTITNPGPGALVITSGTIVIAGTNASDFAQTNDCGASLGAGSSCTASVTFTPMAAGTRSATLQVFNGSGTTPVADTWLTGTGNPPRITMTPSTMTFGSQAVGTTSSTQQVTVANAGPGDLTVGQGTFIIAGTNATDFSQTNTCGSSLPSGSSCTVYITFAPTGSGTRSASLEVIGSQGTVPLATASLSGTGNALTVSLSASTLSFGNQTVGSTSPSQSLTITNNGSGTVTFGSAAISISGANAADFSETAGCGSSLAPGASCTVVVSFAPIALGGRSATLSINDNAAGGPQQVALSGTGVAADLGVTLSATGSTKPGGTITYTVGVTNNGPGPAAGIKVMDSLPAGTSFSSTNGPGCNTPAPGSNGTVACTIGSMPSGTSMSFTISVTVSAVKNSTITDTASVNSTTLDTNSTNNSASASTLVTNKR